MPQLVFRQTNTGIAHRDFQADRGTAGFGTSGIDQHLTEFGEFNGIAHQNSQDLPQALGIADKARRQARAKPGVQQQAFGARLSPKLAVQVFEQLGQNKGLMDQDQRAVLELCVIQQIIDGVQQGLSGHLQAAQIVPVLALQRRRLQQLREAQYGVQGRADFMADMG